MDHVEPPILHSLREGVATLTLNAPARRNALSTGMREALLAGLQEFEADPNCRCIVLTGAGGTFCSGGDIGEMTPPAGKTPAAHAAYRIGLLQDIIRALVNGTRPTVAAVSGHAAGAGLSIACACDYVIAEHSARFAASFTRLGLIADCGLTWSLPRRVGPARARELLASGRTVGTDEALRIGLADQLAESGYGLEAAQSHARAYGATAPLAVMRTREVMADAPASLEAALATELREQAVLRVTDDHQEARKAFAEKRVPNFTGT